MPNVTDDRVPVGLNELTSIPYGFVQLPHAAEEPDMPANEFSFVIKVDATNAAPWCFIPPGSCGLFPEYYNCEADVYSAARGYARRLNDGAERGSTRGGYNVWPRHGSAAHAALIAEYNARPIPNTSGIDSFTELCRIIAALRSNQHALISRVYEYICWKNRGADVTHLQSQLIKYLTWVKQEPYVQSDSYYSMGNGSIGYYIAPASACAVIHTEAGRYSELALAINSTYGMFTCDECGGRFYSQYACNARHSSYCRDCAANLNLVQCSNCGVYRERNSRCSCRPAGSTTGHILCYSTNVLDILPEASVHPIKDKPTATGDYLLYGVELEVLPKDLVIIDDAAHRCGKAMQEYAILKSDSSIGNGFEIVTSPASLYIHKTMVWEGFFRKTLAGIYDKHKLTAAQSVKSWSTGCCGTHVHFTKSALSDMQLAKLLVFYNEPPNKDFLSRIAGRKVGPDAAYCFMDKKRLGYNTARNSQDHHGAVTISQRNNGRTGEVRIFRGNATKHGVIRCIEFVDATIRWCGENSGNDTEYTKFLDWLTDPVIISMYPDLRKHLIQLGYIKPRLVCEKYKDKVPSDILPDDLRVA